MTAIDGCPQCGHTRQMVGVEHSGIDARSVFWCPRCGTVGEKRAIGNFHSPKLVGACERFIECFEAGQIMEIHGKLRDIAEACSGSDAYPMIRDAAVEVEKTQECEKVTARQVSRETAVALGKVRQNVDALDERMTSAERRLEATEQRLDAISGGLSDFWQRVVGPNAAEARHADPNDLF